MKIVINICYGGFSLSTKAILRYAELKGIKLYKKGSGFNVSFYIVPVEEFEKVYSVDKKKGNYSDSNKLCFSTYSVARNDPTLIRVVEELGEDANGLYAELKIIEIPDGTKYTIEEYDGNEHIAEEHQTWF